MKLIILAVLILLTAIPITTTAQEIPEAAPEPSTTATPRTPAADPSIIHVADNPDQIVRIRTRVRHTTVIQLPGRENILDFVVGDSEYWHLTGAANLAFLKPISEGRQHQRRPGLRKRPYLFLPCLRAARPTTFSRSHRQRGRERPPDFTRRA